MSLKGRCSINVPIMELNLQKLINGTHHQKPAVSVEVSKRF